MIKSDSLLLLLVALLVVGCDASESAPAGAEIYPDRLTATVTAGETALRDYPVSATLESTAFNHETDVCINDSQPGQLVPQGDSVSVWWKANVSAGESKTYELMIGERCSNSSSSNWQLQGYESELAIGGTRVVSYVHPTYDRDDVEGTRKPFHHVFSPDGARRLTKGPGGLYTHHRGIFVGYNQISVGDEVFDIWHAEDGEHQQHDEVIHVFAGSIKGGHEVEISWRDREGEPFLQERRELRAVNVDGRLLVDLRTTLESVRGTIDLNGDRQHAGVHFRADQYVADNEENSRFLRPAAHAHLPENEEHNDDDHLDLAWNALQFEIEGEPYTVVYISHNQNPDGARVSERLYGRFGEFIPAEISEGEPLTLQYRFVVADGHDVSREEIENIANVYNHPPEVELSY